MSDLISVKDELPENGQKVISLEYIDGVIPDIESDYSIGIFMAGKFYLGYDDSDYPYVLSDVTHWMPLPTPAK